MSRTAGTTCRVCGEPRRPNTNGLALCDVHLREYWRTEKAARKKRPVTAPPPQIAAPAAAFSQSLKPANARPAITVTGGSVTVPLSMFVAAQSEMARTLKLAVVDKSLDALRFYEVRAISRAYPLTETEYAAQLAALRAAGYIVCVEG